MLRVAASPVFLLSRQQYGDNGILFGRIHKRKALVAEALALNIFSWLMCLCPKGEDALEALNLVSLHLQWCSSGASQTNPLVWLFHFC